MADPGWYPDATTPGWEAWYDGQRWTGDRRPTAQRAPAQQPPEPTEQQAPWPASQQPWQAPQQYQPEQYQPEQYQPQQGYQAQQQYQSQPQQHQPQQQPNPAYGGWQQPQWEPPRGRRRNRKPLIISAAVVIVLVAAGLITWLVWPDDPPPPLTYQGKQVAAAGDTLTSAERSVKSLVTKRHGKSSADTRCYFAQAAKPAQGTKKSDAERSLRCGPVLFVDGDRSREYLSIPITSKPSGKKVELTASTSLDDVQPLAVGDDTTLYRPDGSKPPAGNGGLTVPEPPAADDTLLQVADLGPTSAPKRLGSGAFAVGRSTKISLVAAGYIDRYGQGDNARSAPAGKKLVAFQVSYGGGDVTAGGTARGTLVVPGQSARQLPEANSGEWIVAVVPASGAAVQLADGGFAQTLSLPDGKPGASNLAVLRRAHRTAYLGRSFSVPVRLTRRDGATGTTTIKARALLAELDFWAAANSAVHARSAQNGLLTLNVIFTQSGSTYGFDPELLQLRLPGGQRVAARNVGTGGKVSTVFEVPASFTTGVLTVAGSEKLGALRFAITKPYSLTVSIPAG